MTLIVYIIEAAARPGVVRRVPPHVVTALRALADLGRVVVGAQYPVSDEDRSRLAPFADEVWDSVDLGGPAWPGTVLDRIGVAAWADRIVITGSGWFGPVADLAAAIDRFPPDRVCSMVPACSDAPWRRGFRLVLDPTWWTVPGSAVLDAPLRAQWAADRARTRSGAGGTGDLIGLTRALEAAGTGWTTAFAASGFPSPDPALMNLPLLLDAGLPIVPLASFAVDPLVADKLAVVGRDGLDRLLASGYDASSVWRGLLVNVPLGRLVANLGLTEVLSDEPADDPPPARTVAIVHLHYPDMTDELLDRVDLLPGEVSVVITTTDRDRADAIAATVAARDRQHPTDIRVVASNRGRDISALLVTCADVIADDRFDLVLKIHGKRSVQDDVNASAWFRRHLLDNLLGSSGSVRRLYRRFAEDPSLGIAIPPTIHMGYPVMGHGWFTNRPLTESLADRLGVTVPFDPDTPTAPFGSMFLARRQALLPLLDLHLTFDDFPDADRYADGTLAHALERLFCYVAADRGWRTMPVMSTALAGVEYGVALYKLQAVTAHLPAHAVDQVEALEHRMSIGRLRRRLVTRFPNLADRARRVLRRQRRLT